MQALLTEKFFAWMLLSKLLNPESWAPSMLLLLLPEILLEANTMMQTAAFKALGVSSGFVVWKGLGSTVSVHTILLFEDCRKMKCTGRGAL
jgi:hypothetical protein